VTIFAPDALPSQLHPCQTLSRGRAYAREGRVIELRILEDGLALYAQVLGGGGLDEVDVDLDPQSDEMTPGGTRPRRTRPPTGRIASASWPRADRPEGRPRSFRDRGVEYGEARGPGLAG